MEALLPGAAALLQRLRSSNQHAQLRGPPPEVEALGVACLPVYCPLDQSVISQLLFAQPPPAAGCRAVQLVVNKGLVICSHQYFLSMWMYSSSMPEQLLASGLAMGSPGYRPDTTEQLFFCI